MRKIVVLFGLAAALVTGGCGSTLKVVTGTVTSRVSSPALINLGLGNHRLSITNGTDYFGRVIVNGQKVSDIVAPGQGLYSSWGYQPNSTETPVTMFFFKDSSGTSLVGAADHVFRISRGQPNTSDSWTPRNSDITTPSGRKLRTSTPDPAKFSNFKSREIDFKRTSYGGTAVIQVANLTSSVVVIRIDGRNTDFVSPAGGYAFIERETVGTPQDRTTLQFIFINRGVSREKTVYTPASGVRADCVILTDQSIQK